LVSKSACHRLEQAVETLLHNRERVVLAYRKDLLTGLRTLR
jgi:hypothetical protein